MKPEQQRLAIAEACGWKRQEPDSCFFDDPTESFQVYVVDLPDYTDDLNAMHEAEEIIKIIEGGWGAYCGYLVKGDSWFEVVHATAAQRAEAFLRTIGKWTETNSTKEPTHL
jgi:tRNA A37 N6-isopentenylltransferase MiaA